MSYLVVVAIAVVVFGLWLGVLAVDDCIYRKKR
jgi:hypothetical protein